MDEKIIGSISEEEFLNLSRIAILKLLTDDVCKRYKTIDIRIRARITLVTLYTQNMQIVISLSPRLIRFNIKNVFPETSYNRKMNYYVYNEKDQHYDVINKFKNDMKKNFRQFSKIDATSDFDESNFKIYLYDSEYKTYDNKYYVERK